MAGYADLDEVMRQLDRDPDAAEHAAVLARAAELSEALSRLFDAACGRTGAAAETRTVEAPVAYSRPLGWPFGAVAFSTLVLPAPVLAVTAVAESGTWDGSAWSGELAVDAADYRLVLGDAAGGFRGIERLGGGWAGPVRVTGTWLDAAWDDPPADVVEALTFLVVREFREDAQGPGGTVGPEGLPVPSRNPWRYERVKAAVRRHRVAGLVV